MIRRWRRRLCDRLVIAHVHHGPGPEYRDQAQDFVRHWARGIDLPFVTNRPAAAPGGDEASLRRLRFAHLERWRVKYDCDAIVLAHHRDDLIETRVSGCCAGRGGRVWGRCSARGHRFSAWLEVPRAELAAYAAARGLKWREDPSNADARHGLRAWLRHEWLPRFGGSAPGASG